MKLFKKLIVLALVCFMLAGCQGGGNTPAKPDDKEKASFVLGGSGPLTGGAAIYGEAVKNGAVIAVNEINAKEGYDFFKLNFQDDVHDPETAKNAFYTLLDAGMQVSLLCVTSAPCGEVAGLTQDEDIFAITPSGSRDDIPTYGSNIFQMCFTDSNQGIASADYLAANFKGEKIGVIYQSSVDYSKGIYNTFAAEAAARGLNVVDVETFTDEKDYSVQLSKLKEAGATVVFVPIYYDEASMILTQAGDFKPVWFGVDGMDGILTVEGFDTSLAEGVYLLTPFAADSKENGTPEFVAEYQKQFGSVPIQFAADAYDAVYVIYNCLKAGGADPSMSRSDISKICRDQVTKMTFNGLTGSNITWKASGEVSKEPIAVVIENGEYVLAD